MGCSPKRAKSDAADKEEDLAVEISAYIYVSAPAPPVTRVGARNARPP